jgi:hypothetical protein
MKVACSLEMLLSTQKPTASEILHYTGCVEHAHSPLPMQNMELCTAHQEKAHNTLHCLGTCTLCTASGEHTNHNDNVHYTLPTQSFVSRLKRYLKMFSYEDMSGEEEILLFVRYEVFTATNVKITVFWVVTHSG